MILLNLFVLMFYFNIAFKLSGRKFFSHITRIFCLASLMPVSAGSLISTLVNYYTGSQINIS